MQCVHVSNVNVQTQRNAWFLNIFLRHVFFSHLSWQDAEEDEDEHALEGVGDGEQVGGEGGLVEDVEQAERPGGPQHEEEGQGPAGTGPVGVGAPAHFTSPWGHRIMQHICITTPNASHLHYIF